MILHDRPRRLLTLLTTVSLLGLSGCSQTMHRGGRPLPPALAGAPAELIEPAFWAALLLAGEACDAPAQTASHTQAPSQASSPVERRVYGAEDVVLSDAIERDASLRVVWLKAAHAEGFVSGPVALVALGARRVEIVAMGDLRLPEAQVALQYVDLHEFWAVRVDVQVCSATVDALPPSCRHFMRVMPQQAGRLHAGASADADMDLDARYALPAKRHAWARRVAHTAQVELCHGTVILTESAALQEYHLKRVRMPPLVVRQAEAIRSVRWENNSWKASEQPLWQMMAQTEMPARP